jgi:hypothetical protein
MSIRSLTVGPHTAALCGLALAALVAAGVSQCSPAPVQVVELPAVVELDPRGPVRTVEAVDHDELVGRILRVTDELAEAAAMMGGCDD